MSCDTKYWSETQITRNAVFPGFNNSINIYTGFILIRIHMGVIDSKKQKKSNPCQSCSVVALVSLLEFAIFWGRTLWSLSLCQEFIREKRRFWFWFFGWVGGFFWLVGFLKQQQKNPGHTVIASYLSHFLVCWVVLCKHAALKWQFSEFTLTKPRQLVSLWSHGYMSFISVFSY